MVDEWQIEEVENKVFVLQSRSANANAGTDFRHLPAVALPLACFLGRHDFCPATAWRVNEPLGKRVTPR